MFYIYHLNGLQLIILVFDTLSGDLYEALNFERGANT